MYSQYSYYQNGTSAPQQQAASATTTSGQVWNGQQWVPSSSVAQQPAAAAAPTYAQAAASSIPSTAIIKHGKTHSQLVQHYTTYYHHWNSQSASAKQSLASLPPPHPNTPANNAKREEMERREKWAGYYASNSAALAHYHLALSKGGGVEPYARPASPPVPPQMAAAGGGASAAAAAAAAPAAAPTAGATAASTSSAGNNQQKSKKSRWAQAQGGDQETDGITHGKLSSAAASSTGIGALEAAAVERRKEDSASKQNDKSLYLNKFVQEKKSSPASSEKTNLTNARKSSGSSKTGGTKRKMADRHGSSLSAASGSYYGPSSSSAAEEDYVPLSLDKPLGSSSKSSASSPPLSKKERKRQKKLAKQKQAAVGDSGFDANVSALTERAERFRGKGGIKSASSAPSTVANVEKYMGKTVIGGAKKQLDEHDYERMTVKGTCKKLEKEYLRLTSPPRAELVRPQNILEKHLSNLKESYYNGGKVHGGRARDYTWFCSQFKAIRQDLTVQRITNGFAVDVYETHAKVALEEDDINEYNQSQTQLKELYDLIERKGAGDGKKKGGKRGKVVGDDDGDAGGALKNRNEFIAYRIIYYVFLSGNRKYEGGSSDIFKIMLQLTPEQRKDECIHHALLVRAAVADNDYHKFFQLQDVAPNMGDYLMDKIVPSVRQGALQRICKAYRPDVSAEFVLKELGFDTKSREEVEGGKAWMESCGCIFEAGLLQTKDTVLKGSTGGVKNSLI